MELDRQTTAGPLVNTFFGCPRHDYDESLDVNDTHSIAPVDALIVINCLNRLVVGEGELAATGSRIVGWRAVRSGPVVGLHVHRTLEYPMPVPVHRRSSYWAPLRTPPWCWLPLAVVWLVPSAVPAQDSGVAALRKALTLHAPFDRGPDAAVARGDRSLWNAPAIGKRDAATKGLPAGGEVTLEPQAGRFGGALRFKKSAGPMVFFKADQNFPQPAANWSGTVSFWLSTDPAGDLQEGFCDPLQVTSKQWDDAAMFVEFEKRAAGIPFRLGVYADKSVWNPQGRKWEDIPVAEKPLTAVDKPPFGAGQWTHVAFTFQGFNTGEPRGLAVLYLNAKRVGEISARTQTFTWDPQRAAVMLGLSYIGLMDDLALFDRALALDEIGQLYALKGGVADLSAKLDRTNN